MLALLSVQISERVAQYSVQLMPPYGHQGYHPIHLDTQPIHLVDHIRQFNHISSPSLLRSCSARFGWPFRRRHCLSSCPTRARPYRQRVVVIAACRFWLGSSVSGNRHGRSSSIDRSRKVLLRHNLAPSILIRPDQSHKGQMGGS